MIGQKPDIGVIGEHLASRKTKGPRLHFTRGLFGPAIEELKRDLANVPANDSADAKSFKAAIDVLKRAK
jgi:hypothetical protein